MPTSIPRLLAGFLTWFKQDLRYRKRASRHANPDIAAHYWDGGVPAGKPVKDISLTGAYLYTTERWYVGTIVTLTLEQTSAGEAGSISVPSRIVRHGADGVGVSFMMREKKDRASLERFLQTAVVGRAGHGTAGNAGQALVEYALMIPLLFFLIVNALNFGGFLYAWITVANAARAGAQYAILGGASVGLPAAANANQITALISNDISSLLNPSSLSVSICTNNNGTISSVPTGTGSIPSAFTATCPSFPADPEAPHYVSAAIDVTYTYQPLIPAFNFPGLGIGLSNIFSPSKQIHRRTLMRMIQ